jgi:hypothetical protein
LDEQGKVGFRRKLVNGQATVEGFTAAADWPGRRWFAFDMTSGIAGLLLNFAGRRSAGVDVPARLLNRMAGAFVGRAGPRSLSAGFNDQLGSWLVRAAGMPPTRCANATAAFCSCS